MSDIKTVSVSPEITPNEPVNRLSPIDKWISSHAELRFRESRERAIRGLSMENSEAEKSVPAIKSSGR